MITRFLRYTVFLAFKESAVKNLWMQSNRSSICNVAAGGGLREKVLYYCYPYHHFRESGGLWTLHRLRKSPKAMQKALGLSAYAGQAFSSLSPRKSSAGLRGEVRMGSKPFALAINRQVSLGDLSIFTFSLFAPHWFFRSIFGGRRGYIRFAERFVSY